MLFTLTIPTSNTPAGPLLCMSVKTYRWKYVPREDMKSKLFLQVAFVLNLNLHLHFISMLILAYFNVSESDGDWLWTYIHY